MSALSKIAYYQKRRDEIPNQDLARQLAESNDKQGIQEIAENLWNKNKNIRSDCLKVLYEIGYINPELIADYVEDFLKLLKDKNNRLVWGAMIGLATIAEKRPREIWQQIDEVIRAVDQGTVITVVWGVKTLATIAAADPEYHARLFPILIAQLQKCIPRDLPIHAESVLVAVDKSNPVEYQSVLEARQTELTTSQRGRLRKITNQLKAHS